MTNVLLTFSLLCYLFQRSPVCGVSVHKRLTDLRSIQGPIRDSYDPRVAYLCMTGLLGGLPIVPIVDACWCAGGPPRRLPSAQLDGTLTQQRRVVLTHQLVVAAAAASSLGRL